MGIKKEFGQKIRRMRVNRGLTQEELAEIANISQRALSRIETGENFVSAETLDSLINALNTTTEELFATEHLKTTEELYTRIIDKIDKLKHNSQKLELIYSIIHALSRE